MKKIFALLFALVFILSQVNVFAGKPVRSGGIEAPTGLIAVNITENSIEISWNAVSDATGYYVYRASVNDSNYIQVAKITSNTYKNTGLSSGAAYWYYVKAYNKRYTSSDSEHIQAQTKAVTIPAPTPTPEPTPTPTPEPTPIPTPTPEPTPVPAPSKEVLGFATYYYSGDKSSYNSIVNYASSLGQIATHTYITDGKGAITGLVPTEQINYANNNGITTLAMVSNNFSGSIAKELLESEANRANLISNIKLQLAAYGYKGVCIDLEGVYAANRSQFTAFMSELYSSLKPDGYMVTAAVPAKTSDSLTNSWSGAFDYAALGNFVDRLILMVYDEHYPGGTAGPVASIGWATKVAEYAVSVVPKEKLMLGVAAYGYDWSSNGTKAYSINGIMNIASTYGAVINWDSVSQTPYFTYTDGSGVYHEVWFENSYSLAFKLNVVDNLDLAGIGIWRLGLENADYWNMINSKFAN